MYSNLGHVELDLLNYEFQQDQLERDYYLSLPEKKDEIEYLANEILNLTAEEDIIEQAFGQYWEEDKSDYNEYILSTLDLWYENDLDEEDLDVINSLALLALETACEVLEGEPLYNLASDGGWNVRGMAKELVGFN